MVPFFNHHHKLRKRESLPTNQTQTLDGKVRAGSCCKEVAPQKKRLLKLCLAENNLLMSFWVSRFKWFVQGY